MLTLNSNNNKFLEPGFTSISKEIQIFEQQENILKTIFYYFERRKHIKSLERINKYFVDLVSKYTHVADIPEVLYKESKIILEELKQQEYLYSLNTNLMNDKSTKLFGNAINLAYKFEKLCRVKHFTNQTKKDTSDLAKAVALSSNETTAQLAYSD